MSGEVRERTRLISPVLAIGLALVSALSLIAYFALSAYAPELRNEGNAEANALSSSAIGFAGLRILLQEDGTATTIDRGTVLGFRRARSLTILTPDISNDSAQIRSLCRQSTCLVILPKWIPYGDPLRRGRVMKFAPWPTTLTEKLLGSFAKDSKLVQRRGASVPQIASPLGWLKDEGNTRTAPIDSTQTLSGKEWIPEVVADNGGILLGRLENSEVYVLADPDLMNTHGLGDLATAELAVSIIRQLSFGPGPVSFDVTLNGLGQSEDILRYMFSPPFLGATLAAIIAAMLLGWHALNRFGQPERTEWGLALGKRALVDNTAGLIRMMGREPGMAPRYAASMRSFVLRSLGLTRRLEQSQLDAVLGAIERRTPGDSFQSLSADAAQVKRQSDLMRVADGLFRWRERIIHAR